jgi:hypothetical protein
MNLVRVIDIRVGPFRLNEVCDWIQPEVSPAAVLAGAPGPKPF